MTLAFVQRLHMPFACYRSANGRCCRCYSCWLQLCKEDNRDLSVCVIEKGSEVGEQHWQQQYSGKHLMQGYTATEPRTPAAAITAACSHALSLSATLVRGMRAAV